MNKEEGLVENEIVQLSPNIGNKMFAYCMATVSEVKEFGALVYVQSLGEKGESGGQAYYRARWEDMDKTGGKAAWKK